VSEKIEKDEKRPSKGHFEAGLVQVVFFSGDFFMQNFKVQGLDS
jgi:hypothetical protein